MNVVPIDCRAPADGATARPEIELALVPHVSVAHRARQLLKEARTVSLEHLKAMQGAMAATRELSEAVVEAGDLYAPGLNDFSKRLAEDLFWRAKTLEALIERQRAAIAC